MIIKKYLAFFLVILIFGISLLSLASSPVSALSLKDSGKQLGTSGLKAGYETSGDSSNIEYIIAQTIKVILSFLGVIFLSLTIYGGFLWMTAHGNEDQVVKARKLITEASIGLVVILAAYIITYYVVEKIVAITLSQ